MFGIAAIGRLPEFTGVLAALSDMISAQALVGEKFADGDDRSRRRFRTRRQQCHHDESRDMLHCESAVFIVSMRLRQSSALR